MNKIFGIDISVWQKNIDFQKIKEEGVNFVIARGMYGNAKDTEFENNYFKAKNHNIAIGVYQYGRATNPAQAREEAELLYENCLRGKQFEYPIFYDVEDISMLKLSKEELTQIIKTWCEYLEERGYFVGLYMSKYNIENKINEEKLNEYCKWLAYWTIAENKPKNCAIWQFGGEVNLIRSNKIGGQICDQNYSFIDFKNLIISKKLNGFGNTIKKSDMEIAKEVIEGKWRKWRK